jgi:hypothetical protein
MNIFNIFVLLFLLSAFAIGINLQSSTNEQIDNSIDNASLVIDNLHLQVPEDSTLPNSKGLYKIIETGVKFVGTLGIESMRTGIHFGKDNPQYFTPEFIIKIVTLICILVIVSLLIKPVFYILVFLVMGIMWIIDLNKKKKVKKKLKEETKQ